MLVESITYFHVIVTVRCSGAPGVECSDQLCLAQVRINPPSKQLVETKHELERVNNEGRQILLARPEH